MVVRTVAPVLMMLGHVAAVFASGLFMAQRDTDAPSSAKRAKFLGLVAFLRILKSFLFLRVEARNDIRKKLKTRIYQR